MGRNFIFILAMAILLMMIFPSIIYSCDEWDGFPITVERILNDYLNAIGGQKAVGKLKNRTITGKVINDFSSRDIPIYESHHFESFANSSGKYLTKEYTDNGIYQKGFDGKNGWTSDKGGVKTDNRFNRSKLAWLINPQGILEIKKYFPDLKFVGTVEINGRMAYVLESPELKKAHYTLHFDVESGLLIRIGNYWDIEDYRKVDGVLFPHKIKTSRKGGSTVYEFSDINHKKPIDGSVFMMPK